MGFLAGEATQGELLDGPRVSITGTRTRMNREDIIKVSSRIRELSVSNSLLRLIR